MAVVISKEVIVDLLSSSMPDAEWLLGEIESAQGWFRFPPYISSIITNLKIETYPLLYQNEASIVLMLFRGLMSDEQIKQLGIELEQATLAERSEFLTEFTEGLLNGIDRMEIPKTPAEQEAARERFESLSVEEQNKTVHISQHFFCTFFAMFYQQLSITVHGEKLTSLVTQAIAGDDKAFVKAVQIDRRILTTIPYFKERFVRAQEEADSDFYDDLSYRLKAPPYRGKIRYKTLWLTFSTLEMAGLLDALSPAEIREICDEINLDGFDSRIQTDRHLARRLAEYKMFQKRGVVTST